MSTVTTDVGVQRAGGSDDCGACATRLRDRLVDHRGLTDVTPGTAGHRADRSAPEPVPAPAEGRKR